jgi:hypothetical protein
VNRSRRERLVVRGHANERHDRPERLLAVDQRVEPDVGDDRRLVVEIGRPAAVTRADDDDRRAFVDGILEVVVHLAGRRLVVHRADLRRGVERVAERPLRRRLQHLVEKRVVHALVDEHTFRRTVDQRPLQPGGAHDLLRRDM